MKKIEIISRGITISNPDSIFNYFAWPTVTRLPDGRLAAVSSGMRVQHVCPFGKVVMVTSDDEGKTWTSPSVIIDTPLDDRDAGIAVFGKERNRVIVTSFNNSFEFQRDWASKAPYGHKFDSLIFGYLDTVSPEAEEKYLGSTYKISEDCGKNFGEVRRVPVTSPHGPCAMSDGSLIYIGVVMGTGFANPTIHVYRMDANGVEFEKHSELDTSFFKDIGYPCEVHAIENAPGELIVHIRVQRGQNDSGLFTVYQCESHDGGKTFTTPHQIIGDLEGAPPHLLKVGDTLICAYAKRQKPVGIKVAFSHDGGKTWDEGYIIDDTMQDADLGYPATVALNDGTFLTVYYAKEAGGCSKIRQTIWRYEE